jgi:hypothetical protein
MYGTSEHVDASMRFEAGQLSAELDKQTGNLCTITYAGNDVLEGIGFVVRDGSWGTLSHEMKPPTVELLKPDGKRTGWNIDVRGDIGPMAIKSDITLWENERAGVHRLTFETTAHVQDTIDTARTGFIVLHSLKSTVGSSVEVDRHEAHPDGAAVLHSSFPRFVDGQQPFSYIRSLKHSVAGKDGRVVDVECLMEDLEGNTGPFEMEDQRLWTDGSFKTYVRPLSWPWPYTLGGDGYPDLIKQRITLTFTESGDDTAAPASSLAPAAVVGAPGTDGSTPAVLRMPAITLAVHPAALAAAEAADLSRSSLQMYGMICHLDMSAAAGGDVQATLQRYKTLCARTGATMQLEAVLDCVHNDGDNSAGGVQAEVQRLRDLLAATGCTPTAITLCPAPYLGTSAVSTTCITRTRNVTSYALPTSSYAL